MRAPRTPLLAVAVLAFLALALPSAALAAPAEGVYHGVINGTGTNQCGGNEGEGFFRFKNGAIVPAGNGVPYCGGNVNASHILAPSNFTCNQLNANLTVDSIPVHQGTFDDTSTAPIGPGGANRKVRFSGTWVSNRKVKGFTRISGDGCASRGNWTMKRL